jgi:ferredoxin-NADP reductase
MNDQLAGLTDWNPESDDRLSCCEVRQETRDVKTFVFAPVRPAAFRFRPGQFLTLDVPLPDGVINRCYTIASSSARPYRISITVKRKPDGAVSGWLHDYLRPGIEIRASLPLGDFTPPPSARGKWLMLSGGSGITPLMSMTRASCDLAEGRDIVFVHAARSPSDIIFRAELDLMARQSPRLRLAHICETTTGEPSWAGFTGRVSLPMLRQIAPDFAEREVFCCGPAPFMTGVRTMLGEAGFDMARYHQESFDFAELSAGAPADEPEAKEQAKSNGAVFRIEFAKSGHIVECGADMTILAAAKNAGVRLPSSCTKGLCGTCKSRLISGAVDMKHAGGIRQREIDQGLALLCCSRPTSDVVVDR